VLSGFLLALPWHRAELRGGHPPRLRDYLTRRFYRIVPPYWFCMATTLLLLTGGVINFGAVISRDGLWSILAHLSFTQQLFPVTTSGFEGVHGAVWTLTIEMIFYLALPVVIHAFLGRRWRWGLPAALAISLGWQWLARSGMQPVVDWLVRAHQDSYGIPEVAMRRTFLANQIPTFAFEFALGICAARLVVAWSTESGSARRPRWLGGPGVASTVSLAALVLLGFATYQAGTESPEDSFKYYAAHHLTAVAAAVLIVTLTQARGWVRWLFELKPMRWIGIIGYSVFLWHIAVIRVVAQYPTLAPDFTSSRHRLLILTLWSVPLTLALSAVLYHLVEKPFMGRSPRRREPEPARRLAGPMSLDGDSGVERAEAAPGSGGERAPVDVSA
ncbi:MAG: acyltransferase, partial [Acidimicrobiia bacterium]|nr:acyltransferase [Acidimicrobiia bacterium]